MRGARREPGPPLPPSPGEPRAAPAGAHELTMDIRIYRERPEMARHTKPGAQALWEFLAAAGSAGPMTGKTTGARLG